MDLVEFMLFRFRNIEGVLDSISRWNMTECYFDFGTKIKYDYKNGLVSVITVLGDVTVLPIRECTKENLIKKFNFKERTTNRHKMSF